MPERPPTQIRYPWRSVLRSVAVATVALLPVLPEIAKVAGVETVPLVASTLGIVAVLQRIITIPEVDRWLTTTLNAGARKRQEEGEDVNAK
jgi:hypothetical protein|nr:MAG TPA: hypothetical protein [Caudoviricetes sp.]DAW70287.1 MAG TPA: hypothetical protein [Caudoviricetes sp.]